MNNIQTKFFKAKYLTGIQPTGDIHLGNFISAILPWLKLQKNNFETSKLKSSELRSYMIRPLKYLEDYKNTKELELTSYSDISTYNK